MKFKSLIALAIIFILSIPAIGANTVSFSHPVINISSIDSDWDDSEIRKFHFIIFVPGAVNDILVIKQSSATGPELSRMKSSDGEPRIVYFNGTELDMYLDYSDCTLNAGSKVLIMLWER